MALLFAASLAAHADWFVSPEVKALKIKAEAGDVQAQFLIGASYDSGHGAPHDGAQAFM